MHELSRPRRIGILVTSASMSTLLVWSTSADAYASPVTGAVVLLLMVAGVFVIVRLARTGPPTGSVPLPETSGQRRPRPLREVPRDERRRLWIYLGATALMCVGLIPAVVGLLTTDAPLASMTFPAVLLGLAVAGGVSMWRQLRYPSARTLAAERVKAGYHGWRLHLVTWLLYPVVLVGAGLAYQALEPRTVLAVGGAFAVSLLLLPGLEWVTERFAKRRPAVE